MREVKKASGKRQYEMNFGFRGEPFMMLVSDMCLYWDDEYRGHAQYYDRRRLEFRRDAAQAWRKLIELGCEGILTPEAKPPREEMEGGGRRRFR